MGGFIATKQEDWPIAFLLFGIILIGTPIAIYYYSEISATQRILRLIKYFVLFVVFLGLGTPVGEQVLLSPEERTAIEKARNQKAITKKKEKEDLAISREKAMQKKGKTAERKLESYRYEVSVAGMNSEFEANTARANDKYKGNRVRVHGIVHRIEDGILGRMVEITLTSPGNINCIFNECVKTPSNEFISCEVPKSNKTYLSLSKGDRASITGEFKRDIFGLELSKCMIN